MRRASILQAVLLAVATLQLQSACGSSIMWAKPARVQALSATDIVEKAEKFVKVCIAIEHLEIERNYWHDMSTLAATLFTSIFRTD